jgi:hypothetical protein
MKGFGLISLLITISLIAWWFSNSGAVKPVGPDGETEYEQALDSARAASELMER